MPFGLRINFFGSDGFSLQSLKAVRDLSIRRNDLVKSVSLISRRLKRSGRGQKTITEPIIVQYAKRVGIPWLEVETAEDFQSLVQISPASMAIAVSYGKLIPASYLQLLQFPSLNVHPSLLPQYRGAAPIQWAIMDRAAHTGVSVQTLHPTKFDQGRVLWQSDPIAISRSATFPQLYELLGGLGAQGLENVLEHRLYKDDARDFAKTGPTLAPASWAPAIKPPDHEIRVDLDRETMEARGRALSHLHFLTTVSKKRKSRPARVIVSDFFLPDVQDDRRLGSVVPLEADHGPGIGIKLRDGYLGAKYVQMAGYTKETPDVFFAKARSRGLEEHISLTDSATIINDEAPNSK